MTNQKLDLERALKNPKDAFGTPEKVLSDSSLDRENKRAILRSWEQDARELMEAEAEGMGRGEPNMLQRVLRALDAVDDHC
ncbi:MAG TPA: hypothetical protein VKN76_17595 [Kiloniellaceae bacterium]|nr:hypothetical protein [Kiloniellaceae bacterium]